MTAGSTELPALGLRIRCHVVEKLVKSQENRNSPCTFACKCAMMEPETLVARPRAEGDAMRLAGGSRTLKRLMIDRKIPAAERDALAVIADRSGVIAVQNIGMDLSRRPGNGARLEIKIERN